MKKIYLGLGAAALSISIILGGCGVNNTVKGAGIGTGAGAAIGAGIGNVAGNTGVGAIIGAVVGGVAGGIIGDQMDKQKRQLESQVPEAQVETVNNGEAIKVTFDSGILFGVDKTTLSPESREALSRFAANMNANPDTDIRIVGHTDSTGRHQYNMDLSDRRAKSVVDFLVSQNVTSKRIMSQGVGPDQPIADNSTQAGRAKNRRVEIFIVPGAKMIQKAKTEAKK